MAQFDFLIHAMLGLGASHLSVVTETGYADQAISHRVAAIRGLNQALSRPCVSGAEGDARFAATMALTFVSPPDIWSSVVLFGGRPRAS